MTKARTTRHVRVGAAVLTLAAVAAGCGLRSRTALDEISGIDRVELAAMLADGGISVGELRTAELPDGTTVAIVVPEPSDGYPPQVSVLRVDGGEPAFDSETVCDPFLWATTITGDLFYGLEPARVEAVTWGRWDGGEPRDLVIDVATEVTGGGGGYGGGAGRMVGRCIFRLTREPDVGPVAAAVLSHLVHAESTTEYAGQRTEIVEEHSAHTIEDQPDQIDFTVTTRTTVCFREPETGTVCAPRTVSTTIRYVLSGEGLDLMYAPLGDALYGYYGGYYGGGYGGGYRGPPDDPLDDYGYEVPDYGYGYGYEDPGYDDGAAGYDDEAAGYDDGAAGYDDEAAGYDDESAGYDDEAAAYDDEAAGYDDESAGDDDEDVEGIEGEIAVPD